MSLKIHENLRTASFNPNLLVLIKKVYVFLNGSFCFQPDDTSLVLGNYQGDLTVRSLSTDEERVLEGVGHAPIIRVEPAKDGKRLLVIEEGVWRNACDLFSLQNMAVV